MAKWAVAGVVLCAFAALAIFLIAKHPLAEQDAGAEQRHPIPRAVCGPHDRTETVQGETTMAERFAPGEPKAYRCNLELIGQNMGQGSSIGMEAYGQWVYLTTWQNADTLHPGVTVLDVANPRLPKVTAYLDTPAMLRANESLAISRSRKLLLAADWSDSIFDIYDLSKDPGHPTLISSTSIPAMMSHMGQFSADGSIYFGAIQKADPRHVPAAPRSALIALDVRDPARPKALATWVPKAGWQTHSIKLSEDGTKGYVAIIREADDQANSTKPNGLMVVDLGDFKAVNTKPRFRPVSTLFWDDSHFAQDAIPYRSNGRSYVVFTDLVGALGWQSFPPPASACRSGKPGRGFPRIIDVTDGAHPRLASRLMLEVSSSERCLENRMDPVVGYGYGTSACDVDNVDDAKLMACNYWEGGLRIFDIRNPAKPAEIAYYKPPAVRTARRAAAPHLDFMPGGKDHTADQVMAPRFRSSGREIWFNSFDNGFQVVRFSDAFQSSRPELFSK